MYVQALTAERRPAPSLRPLGVSKGVNRIEILRVLARAAEDLSFVAALTDHGEEALRGYDLSSEAKAAILSGDIRWLRAHLGWLDARLRTWPDLRLQQEKW